MVHCVAETCRKEIDPSYQFCPFCGCDNRAPEHRPAIAPHQHYWVMPVGYCIVCGEPQGEPYGFGSKTRIRLATFSFLAGLLLFAFIGLCAIEKDNPGNQMGKWVASWWFNTYTSVGRYGHTTVHQTGTYVATITGIVAFLLCLIGIVMFLRVPAAVIVAVVGGTLWFFFGPRLGRRRYRW